MPYIGKSPHFGVRNRFIYTATGDETSKSGADDNGATLTFTDGAYVDVYLNGVLLKPDTDYVTSTANTIGSLSALSTSDILEVIVYDVFSVSDTVSAASGGTFQGAVGFNGGVSTALTPSSADGVALGSASLEWSDLYLADSGVIYFGNDQDVTLTHVADQGLTLKSTATDGASGLGPVLNLSTGDTDIASGNQLGTINFQAPDEGTGTDAVLVGASITAIAQGAFSSSSNATSLLLRSSNSGTNDGGYLEIKNDGDIRIAGGDIFFSTADKGINLGVTSNTDSNTLDDYEEGTFTVTFTCGTSGTLTLSNNELCYTKIGRIVHVTGSVNCNSVSSPQGTITIGTLPFTSIDTTDTAGKSIGLINIQAADIAIDAYTIWLLENATTATIYTATTAQPASDAADQFGGNETALISLTYVAA